METFELLPNQTYPYWFSGPSYVGCNLGKYKFPMYINNETIHESMLEQYSFSETGNLKKEYKEEI